MHITTWNVNSIRAREEHLTTLLASSLIDVIALQETKVIDELFPLEAFKEIGYYAAFSGQKSYNGVAFLSKTQPKNITTWQASDDPSKRVIAANFANLRIINVYIPNGQSVGSDKFEYKLRWLEEFIGWVKQQQKLFENIIILGDFNIAPGDADVFDTNIWHDCILTSRQERGLLDDLLNLGFNDTFRNLNPTDPGFSWWDYRGGAFRQDHGLRIDLILASNHLKLDSCSVEKEPRSWTKPSDHTPVTLTLAKP